jgi:sugar O-acyltransferase (sialic acid O-acetyltransferase NeuD family)
MSDNMKRKIKKTIIYGCGDMGIQTYNILKHDPDVEIIGFLDDDAKHSTFLELPVLGSLDSIDQIKKTYKITHGIVTIGDNQIRSEKTKALINEDLKILKAVHPQSFIDNIIKIGSGTIVEMGAFIHPETIIGKGCFICSGSIIAHNSVVEDYVLIAGGVVFGSRVSIGSHSLIGVGANISPYISIGKNVIVGTGSAVIKNLPDNIIAAGVPAQILRENPKK